ncbi:MAG: murein biosynthesis integral membrane protein MurJ [Parvibaculaceae bacterium]
MSLLRSAATVGSLTMASRILGFVRDMLTAAAVGTGPVAQAFVVAFRFPNLFRSLFAEGAFNSAFVPMYARKLAKDGEAGAHAFADQIYSALFAWLLLFTAAAEVAMPLIMFVIAPGFTDDPSTFDLAVDFTRIAFPYLLFMSLTAMLSGVLNSLHRFVAAATAPVVLNIVMIAALLIAHAMGWSDGAITGYALSWAVGVAGLFQFLLLWIACRRAGVTLWLKWPRWTPDVSALVRRGIPGVISGGITQVNLLIATMIATTIDRAVSYLYYADRIYQLPLGVVGVAIGVVLLPDMSRKLGAGDEAAAVASQNRALELALFLTLPAAFALIAIPTAIINVCFEHGAFTASDTAATALALGAFAAGLPAFVLNKVFSPGYFAREDTRTPMRFAIMSVAINISCALVLSRYIGHLGIASATAIAAWVNALLLMGVLMKRRHFALDARMRERLPRMLLACLVMTAVLIGGLWPIAQVFEGGAPIWQRAALLGLLIGGGIVAYFGSAHFLGAMRLGEIRRMMRR